MWEGSYALEPFDLRLTVIRMMRNLKWIIGFTLLGALVFGGGYYVKNVVFGNPSRYETTITCKLEYTNPPVQSGDYYINEMTWNTYVDSEEFLKMVEASEPFAFMDVTLDMWVSSAGGAAEAISASVASDIHVPSFKVSTTSAEKTELLAGVVQRVLTGPFAESVPEIASMKVIDVSGPELVHPDVRPVRAVILSALLSCFFAVVFLLLREIGADSIWLPATLRKRYGLRALGALTDVEFCENTSYLFGDKNRIAVCAVEEGVNPQEVIESLQEKLPKEWFAVPTPLLSPEAARTLRGADGVLLVVEAGLHAGKPLEYVLEYMEVQEISITAALLWNADEALIKAYYFGRR